ALASAGTYTFSGGTNPTDTTNGVTGTLSAASMSVDFSSNLVTSLSFQITAAETWDSVLTSPASINSDGSFTGTLTTDINDSGVITTGSGAVAGGFSGTLDSMGVPSGAYFGYNVTGTSSFTGTNTTRDWQGAVALTRQ
ncbi:MAG: hypothetical protein OEZ47_11470, partial [Gammaproteobacteria bacterium]|nr:hypothetical protein [Gammaproteobacteria bacterium]